MTWDNWPQHRVPWSTSPETCARFQGSLTSSPIGIMYGWRKNVGWSRHFRWSTLSYVACAQSKDEVMKRISVIREITTNRRTTMKWEATLQADINVRLTNMKFFQCYLEIYLMFCRFWIEWTYKQCYGARTSFWPSPDLRSLFIFWWNQYRELYGLIWALRSFGRSLFWNNVDMAPGK